MFGSTVASASSSKTSASELVSLAVHNAEASGWVHETSILTGSGHRVSSVNDVGTTEGRQVIDSNGAHATVLVVGGNAYIYADAKAIATYFEISTLPNDGTGGETYWVSSVRRDGGTVRHNGDSLRHGCRSRCGVSSPTRELAAA